MKRRQKLIISGLCALAVAIVFLWYAQHVRDEGARARTEAMRRYGGEVASLVVAARAIEAGEVVSKANVEQRDWLSSLAPEDACVSLDEVLGREVTVPVAKGNPLTSLNFRDTAELADIPSGHVAVTVPLTEKLGIISGVAAGSHVVAYRVSEGATRVLTSDVTVLVSPGASGSLSGKAALTIAVSAKDVPEVLTASTAGDLRLVVPADDVKAIGKEEAPSADVPPIEGDARAGGQDEGREG